MQGPAAAAWPAGTLRAGVQAQVWSRGCGLGWGCCSPLPAPGRAAATVVTLLCVTVCGCLAGCCSQQQKAAALGWICLVLPSCFIYSFFLSLSQNWSRLVVITGKRWYPHGIWQTADLPTLNLGCCYRLWRKQCLFWHSYVKLLTWLRNEAKCLQNMREAHTHRVPSGYSEVQG